MTQSELLKAIRFPLMALVVVAHILPFQARPIAMSLDIDNIYIFISELISHGLSSSLNPLFFMMSGLLFFQGQPEITPSLYRQKLYSRWYSLVIPYFLWITITIVSNILRDLLIGNINDLVWSEIMTWSRLTNQFWSTPADFPLWFVRDLMCMSLISPLIYGWVKYTRSMGLLLLYILYLVGIDSGIPGFSMIAITAFGAGAYLAIHRPIDILGLCDRYGKCSLALWVGLCIGGTLMNQSPWGALFLRLSQPIGIIAYFTVFRFLFTRIPRFKVLMDNLAPSAFFVYALHLIHIEGIFKGFFSRQPLMQTGLWQFITYVSIPTLTILVCLGAFYSLKYLSPSLLNLLTGNRQATINKRV